MASIRLLSLLTFSAAGTLAAQSLTTTVVTSTPAPNEVVFVSTACSATCPSTDNSGNALIASSSCGNTCLFCRWNWPGGNHFAQYDTTSGAVTSPIGVAANPSRAAVTCATSTSTSIIYPSRTTAVATSTPTPGEIVSTTTTCSSICPQTDNSGNALIETFSCGNNCLFCRWNWPGGNHFAQYLVDTGAVFSPIGVAANPNIAAVACTTAAVTSFLPSSSSTSSTASPTASIASGWHTAIPCATDTPSRILTDAYITNSNTNTPLSCTQKCFSLGFTYAGVEYGNECYCGAGLVSDVAAANIADCDMPCAGDTTLTCGAGWRMQVYDTTLTPPANVAPSGWRPYGTTGCSRDSASRVFANAVSAGDVLASTNTPAACMSYCTKLGYSMSGVEYMSECYCGNAWTSGTPPADIPTSSCNMPCSGAPGTTCGGSWAIQIYVSS